MWRARGVPDEDHCVLIWDCAPAHLCATTVAEADRLRIRLVVVPECCTGLIQTADVAIFRRLKVKTGQWHVDCWRTLTIYASAASIQAIAHRLRCFESGRIH